MAVPIPDRCVEPGCGVVLVPQRPGLRVANLPPGHGVHYGHGLCRASLQRARRRGELHRYPRIIRTPNEVLETWQNLRRPPFDYSAAQIAQVLGMPVRALERALYRARKRSDPRAVPARGRPFTSTRARRRSPQPATAGPRFDPDTRDEGEETA